MATEGGRGDGGVEAGSEEAGSEEAGSEKAGGEVRGAAGGLEGLRAIRRAKLEQLRRQGSGYPNDFRPSAQAADLAARYGEADDGALEKAAEVQLAGRLMLRRVMGKASFATLRDSSGDIQIYLSQKHIGDQRYEQFRHSDIGDLVGVSGQLMRTRKGELTVQLSDFRLLVKALRPLPEKYRGLSDRESRARKPYLGLMLEGAAIAYARARMNAAARRFMAERGYLEVETPMMQPMPGGANARPFITHHNVLDRDLYMRIAPELYLKMLLVGGLDRIYELNRNFRNEGISARHNPEFTMLEFYRAWADWQDGMAETEALIRGIFADFAAADPEGVAAEAIGRWPQQFPRRTMVELVAEHQGMSAAEVRDEDLLRQRYRAGGKELPLEDYDKNRELDWGFMLLTMFETWVEPRLEEPILVTHFPLSVSPLARASEDEPDLAERWEFIVGGREIAAGYSELNDPQEQDRRFSGQTERRQKGDIEAMPHDQAFIEALEYGMPPAAGVGVGMDRLLMLLTGSASIRDVILFPHLRQKPEEAS